MQDGAYIKRYPTVYINFVYLNIINNHIKPTNMKTTIHRLGTLVLGIALSYILVAVIVALNYVVESIL